MLLEKRAKTCKLCIALAEQIPLPLGETVEESVIVMALQAELVNQLIVDIN